MFDSFLNLNTSLATQFQGRWFLLIFLWVLPWKGVALWKSTKKWSQEMVYRFIFTKYLSDFRNYLYILL